MSSMYRLIRARVLAVLTDGMILSLMKANLGPQVPGGAPGAALCISIGCRQRRFDQRHFLADAEAMIGSFMRFGMSIGGHRDEHSAGKQTVGCGAIDAMDVVLARMTDPSLVDDQKRVIKILMGKDFNRDIFLRDMGAAVVVNGRANDYFRDREKNYRHLRE